MLSAVEQYYSARFAEHGASARGVDWNSDESQQLRFEQLTRTFEDAVSPFSVNDLGCGYGALASYLEPRGVATAYSGYELSRDMIEEARSRFRDKPWARFVEGSAMEQADYSVASGIFNVKLTTPEGEWAAYVDETIADLARASRRGFAFNMLTLYSDADRRRPDLYYADPRVVFDMCMTRYARNVAVLHDYGLWEFTVIVRLER
jgi:SAM-dependent methyltransferase